MSQIIMAIERPPAARRRTLRASARARRSFNANLSSRISRNGPPALPVRTKGRESHSSRQPYEKPLEILQKALKHPEGLLMNLDPADDEVLSFEVVCGTGSLAQRMRIA